LPGADRPQVVLKRTEPKAKPSGNGQMDLF
jgi:hypothetical protein